MAQKVKEAEKLKEALYRLYHSITNHSPAEEK
jgi:hemerythrin superfamily protein